MISDVKPVQITDGTNKASVSSGGALSVSAVGTGVFDVTPASPSASDYLPVRLTDGSSFYSASGGGSTLRTHTLTSGEVTLATAVGTKSIMYLFHPATVATTLKVWKIWLTFRLSHTAGVNQLKIAHITAENGTPGGTTISSAVHDRGDAALAANTVARYNAAAPTRLTPLHVTHLKAAAALTGDESAGVVVLFDVTNSSTLKPLTIRASQAEGIEVYQQVTTLLTGAPICTAHMLVTEE